MRPVIEAGGGAPMGYRLGIDLGTTFTAAAVGNGQQPEMLGLGNRALQIPSVLFLAEDGQFLVGEAAERRGQIDPSRVVREFKRRIGDPVPVLVAGTPYSPQALTARLLAWVVAAATERQGAAPDEVVLTHPANWGAYKRELLDQVFAMADVTAARTCPEPQAAAIQYAARARLEPGARVAVYDLGGGTFDVCVLEKTADGFTILGSPDGVEHLGGVDFDEAVFQHVLAALGPTLADLDPTDNTVKVALNRLRRDCVEAKEALSADVETVVPVALPGRNAPVRLTRSELESLIGPSLQDTVAATSRALRAADTTSGQLTAIVLVGGSSRIPMVSHLLQSTFATTTSLDTHPKHDIALGAVQFELPEQGSTPAVAGVPAAERTEPVTTTATTTEPATTTAIPTMTTSAAPAAPLVTPVAPGEEPAGPPRPARGRWIAAAAAAAVVAASVTGFLVFRDGDNSSGADSAAIGGTPSPAPSSTVPALPRAATALAASQLLVPLEDEAKQSGLDIYRADAKNPSERVRLTTAKGDESNPALSPDRRTMIYVHVPDTGPVSLLVAGVDGRGSRPLFRAMPAQCAGGAGRPGWNPRNPEVLAMTCRRTTTGGKAVYTLNLVDLQGKVLRTLDTQEGRDTNDAFGDPTFAPDGSQVAYWAVRDGDQGIFVVPATGAGQPRRLTTGADADPAWAPAGDGRLAYRHALGGAAAVIVVTDADGAAVACAGTRENNPLGGELCRITDGKDFDQDPTWSGDSTEIAFKGGRDFAETSAAATEIVPADGSAEPRQVWTGDPGNQAAPAWTTR